MKNFGKIVIAGALSLAIVAGGSIIGGYYLGNNSSAQSISDAERNGYNEGYNQGSSIADKEKELLWQRLEKQFKEKQDELRKELEAQNQAEKGELKEQYDKEKEQLESQLQQKEEDLNKYKKFFEGDLIFEYLGLSKTVAYISCSDSPCKYLDIPHKFIFLTQENKIVDLDTNFCIEETDSAKIVRDGGFFAINVRGDSQVNVYKTGSYSLEKEFSVAIQEDEDFSFCNSSGTSYVLVGNKKVIVGSGSYRREFQIEGLQTANAIKVIKNLDEDKPLMFTFNYDLESGVYTPVEIIDFEHGIKKEIQGFDEVQSMKNIVCSDHFIIGVGIPEENSFHIYGIKNEKIGHVEDFGTSGHSGWIPYSANDNSSDMMIRLQAYRVSDGATAMMEISLGDTFNNL